MDMMRHKEEMIQNAMRTMLYIPVLICMLVLGSPAMLSAASTYDVAVPLRSQKSTKVHKNVTISTKHALRVGTTYSTPTMNGGTYRPLQTTSSAHVQSWNAGALQQSTVGGNQVLSVGQSDVRPTTFSISRVGSPLQRPARGSSLLETETTRTKRRAYGSEEEGDMKFENGTWWLWDGEDWVEIDAPAEPPVPVGDVPWWLLAILIVGWKRFARLRKAADAAEVR